MHAYRLTVGGCGWGRDTAVGKHKPFLDIESSEVMDALDRYVDALHESIKRSASGDPMSVSDQVLLLLLQLSV
jgi:hypothetical protein